MLSREKVPEGPSVFHEWCRSKLLFRTMGKDLRRDVAHALRRASGRVRECLVRFFARTALRCQPDPPRSGSFAGSGGGRALSTHARQAGLSDQPWAVRALPQPPPPPASRARLQAGRACSRTGREFLQASLCGVGAPLLQRGQRVRPRSPIGCRGNALCSEQAQASQARRQERDVPGMLVTGGVPRTQAAQKLEEGAPEDLIIV